MKNLVVFVLFATFANSLADECPFRPVPLPAKPFPCSIEVDKDTYVQVTGEKDCSDHKDECCFYEGECVARPTGKKGATQKLDGKLYDDADGKAKDAELDDDLAGSRSLLLGMGLPGLSKTCIPPPPFPASCKIARDEPYVTEPPIDIPYCFRIKCMAYNAPYDKSLTKCGSQPGCYFDQELYEYREAFGASVLPGVPVCHMAIRSKFFQQKSQKVVAKYGSWNPYFTNCLLNEFSKEIKSGPKGCELLPILDAFGVTAKLAGWPTITPYGCALIDGCWRPDRGCYYPVDISQVQVKSGQKKISFKKDEIVFGRPKCQSFDASTPLNILKSYHRCLSAGCTVASKVTSFFYENLYKVGMELSSDNHWKFWNDVGLGRIGAHNIDTVLPNYGYVPGKSKPFPRPTPTPVFKSTTEGFKFPGTGTGGTGGTGGSYVSGGGSGSSVSKCGYAFRDRGGRPCPPEQFPGLHKPTTYCPYKPFFVPRFKPLKGTFVGCCVEHLCYLPKSAIYNMHSGPSIYYSEWSLYTKCSVTCGVGERKRYRKCITQDQSRCTAKTVETTRCNKPCAGWATWGPWSPCPKNACFLTEPGITMRSRKCLPPGGHCPGSADDVKGCKESQGCPTKPPPSNPFWPGFGQG